MAYLPKERILVEADAFDPGMPASAPPMPVNALEIDSAKNLLENITRLNLDFDTLIAVHYPPDFRPLTKADITMFVDKGN